MVAVEFSGHFSCFSCMCVRLVIWVSPNQLIIAANARRPTHGVHETPGHVFQLGSVNSCFPTLRTRVRRPHARISASSVTSDPLTRHSRHGIPHARTRSRTHPHSPSATLVAPIPYGAEARGLDDQFGVHWLAVPQGGRTVRVEFTCDSSYRYSYFFYWVDWYVFCLVFFATGSSHNGFGPVFFLNSC